MKNKPYYPNDNNQQQNKLKDCKLEKYKIDNDLKVLYKVTTTYNNTEPKILKTLPLEELDNKTTDFFFMLMKSYQCDNFAMYYENNYDIKQIINLIYNQDLNFTPEQLVFLKKFFNNVRNTLITLFDMRIKPIINSTVASSISKGDSINNTIPKAQRILN